MIKFKIFENSDRSYTLYFVDSKIYGGSTLSSIKELAKLNNLDVSSGNIIIGTSDNICAFIAQISTVFSIVLE